MISYSTPGLYSNWIDVEEYDDFEEEDDVCQEYWFSNEVFPDDSPIYRIDRGYTDLDWQFYWGVRIHLAKRTIEHTLDTKRNKI